MESEEIADRTLADFAKLLLGSGQDSSNQEFLFVEPVWAKETVASAPTPPNEIVSIDKKDVPATEKQAAGVDYASTNETMFPIVVLKEALPSAAQKASADGRATRSAAEMVDIILKALRSVDGVPERGFLITVYGTNPWNAMLTIKPEAGPIKDAPLWRRRVQEIAIRFREDFDVVHAIQ